MSLHDSVVKAKNMPSPTHTHMHAHKLQATLRVHYILRLQRGVIKQNGDASLKYTLTKLHVEGNVCVCVWVCFD